jgi:uncharacterized protein YndB with AHSA1/START domain
MDMPTKNKTAEKVTVTSEIDIKSPISAVWEALTEPDLVKRYFFNVDIETDWSVGSEILYHGEWEGKKFEDKGYIREFEPEKTIAIDYLPSSTGIEDKPENYHRVTYELNAIKSGTHVLVSQDNTSPDSAKQHKKNWDIMLKGLKKMLEAK